MGNPFNQVVGQRDAFSGTVSVSSGRMIPAFLGVSRGKDTTITDEHVVRGLSGLSDVLAHTWVRSITQISDTDGGSEDYEEGIDYQLIGSDTTNYSADWSLASVLGIPSVDTPTGTTGYMTSAIHYFVVSAVNGNGETTQSTQVSLAITGGGVILTWAPVKGATSYKVFRRLPTSEYGASSLVGSTASTTMTITTDTLVTGTPALTNTAYHRPVNGATYYVTYKYGALTANTPKRFYALDDVKKEYGIGSQLSNMIEKVMGSPGFGNSCGVVEGVAVSADTSPAYITAIDTLETRDIHIFCMGKSNQGLNAAARTHAVDMSGLLQSRNRYFMAWQAAGADAAVEATALSHRRQLYCAPGCSTNISGYIQGTDGEYTDSVLTNEYLASGILGKICALPDTATPMLNKNISGFTTFNGTVNNRDQNEALRTAGVYVIVPDDAQTNGAFLVYGDNTTDGSTDENRQPGIGFTDDQLFFEIKSKCKALLGQKITGNLISRVKTIVKTVLEFFQKEQLIASFIASTITASQDSSHPTWINGSFKYVPLYGLEAILFTWSFDLNA